MKNFTNSFKQFTSRLSARWLIMALMMLVGTSSAWAFNQSAVDLYFDNSTSKWTNCYVYIGHGSYTSCYAMSRVSGTQYLWKLPANFNSGSAWDNATGWVVCKEKWWDSNGEDIYKFVYHGNNNVTNIRTSAWNATTIYKANTTTNVNHYSTNCTVYNFSTSTKSNYTVTINSATGGTLTVKDYDNNTVSNGASKINLTVLKFSASPSTGYTFNEVRINNGSSTTTISAANLASQTYTITSNVTITPVWTAETYDITYKDQGNETFSGTHASGYPTKHTYGTATTLKTASKIGYTFGGWFTNSTCTGTEVTSLGATAYTANITLYAKWEKACTTVETPNVTADDICAGSTATLTLTNRQDGVTYRLNNATTGDIIFGSEDTYTTPAALNDNTTYTIYASHEDACDGTNNVSDEVTVTVNAIPATPNVITSATVCPNTAIALSNYDNGVANVSWYTTQQCSQEVTSSISIDADKTYYARAENGNCYSDVVSLALSVYEAPAAPDLSPSGKINVGQNKSTTITVNNMDANATYACYNANDQEVGTWNGNSVTFNVGDATGEFTYSIVATHGTCADLSTPTEFTVKVEEAGVKIAALGSTVLYENDPTHFIPMYVSNEYLAGVDANSVTNYTWQYSEDGTSGWIDCTRSYSNFNAANNQSNGNVVVTNGSGNCNNWRANQVGYYRCKLTYNNDKEQVSGNIQVTGTDNNKTNKQHIGITYNLPIISVNTGAKDFPSDANLATISSNCGSSKYPSIHADDLKKKRSVDVMMFNPNGTICYDRKARMNYRGSSSLNFQKKSYAFCPGKEKCGDDEKGADYVKTNKENLFGLSDGAADKDWVLYAATPDPSMMRNRLVFDLYKKMRPDEWGVNSMYVELVVNGEYRGVYVLMDKITNNENRVNIKNENGFIVKFDKTDVVDRVENTEGDQKTFATSRTGTKNSSNGNESYGTCIDQRFEIEYPEKEDIQLWDAFYGNVQQRFEDFETALANKDYATVRTLIDYDSWADWFIITEFAKNQDGFRASCIFVYDGDKIEARPLWDQELSFNNGTRVKHGINSPEGLIITTSSVYGDAFYPPFWFTGHKGTSVEGGLLNDPCFVSLVKQKWATYQSGICSAASIGNMVADYNTELGDAISREAARWPYTEAVRGTTTDGDYIGYYNFTGNNPEGNSSTASSFDASKNAITAWIAGRSTALTAGSGLGKAINDLNGEALIFTISPSNVETTPWKQVLLTVNAPEGYEYTFDDSSINNATVRASVKKDNNTYAIKIPRPTAWGIGGNGDPDTQTQYQVSATIEVSGENQCGTIQNGTATSTIKLTDVTEDCNPEIVKPQ